MKNKLIVLLVVLLAVLMLAADTPTVSSAVREHSNLVVVDTDTGCTLNYLYLQQPRWAVMEPGGLVVYTTESEARAVDYLLNNCGPGVKSHLDR